MDYNLSHPKRKKIFERFLYSEKLRFSELEKSTGIRSNELAYFLQKLLDEKIIEKEDHTYKLSKEAEKYIPFFATAGKFSPLPVVLVAYENNGKLLLLKRAKRPYANYWGLIGGRILIDETIEQAAKRQIKEKAFVEGEFESVNAVIHERVKEEGNVLHAYFHRMVTVKGNNAIKEKDNLKWFYVDNLPENTIPSDLWMIRTKLGKTVIINEEVMDLKGGKLALNLEKSPLVSKP